MAVMPFALLGGGTLTGKYLQKNGGPRRYDIEKLPESLVTLIEEVETVAKEAGRTPSQVAINWVRQQQERALIIPILGARTREQVEDNLACLEWELSSEQLKRLDEASKISYDFPLGWLEGAREYVYGKTFEKIDPHNERRFPSM
jgi:aryl-alcohol dehydrogenase-like predicted oxidoreductase